MDQLAQILEGFHGSIPNDSRTAAAIARGAGPEEIGVCATADGLHGLAAALFDAELVHEFDEPPSPEESLTDQIVGILQNVREKLPPDCETARLINSGASLEEISQSAEREGLAALTAVLFEAEQEREHKGLGG